MENSQRTCTIGINNIPDERTEEEIKKVFSPYGAILSISFPVGKISGLKLGICTIVYSSEEECIRAYTALNGDYLGGDKPIAFHFYSPDLQAVANRGDFPEHNRAKKHFQPHRRNK